MSEKKFDVNKLRVAAPCPMSWDAMRGDNRQRFCDSCQLNVFNVAELNEREVSALVAKSKKERVCVKLYRRADGTVITRDCPVGLHTIRRRAIGFAGAAFVAILSLFSVSFAQSKKGANFQQTHLTKIITMATKNQESNVRGVVRDVAGAVVPGIKITLRNKETKNNLILISDSEGIFESGLLSAGNYTLKIHHSGFKVHKLEFMLNKNEAKDLEITLFPSDISVTVGIFAEESLIDVRSSSTTYRITREMIDRLPH
jgi:hypothetical protein